MGYNVKIEIPHWICPALSLAWCAMIPACSWFGWKDEPVRFGVVSVRLQALPSHKKSVTYARAMPGNRKGAQPAGLQRLGTDGSASFVVKMGESYDVCIFTDMNKNQAPDVNEPVARASGLSPTPAAAEVRPITLALGHDGYVLDSNAVQPATRPPTQAAPGAAVPAEVRPYVDNLPIWVREKMAQ